MSTVTVDQEAPLCVCNGVDVATTYGGPRIGGTSRSVAVGSLVTVPSSRGNARPHAGSFEAVPAERRRETALAPLTFEQFYRVEYPRVVALAQSLTGSRQLAEELAQEGFISAHARWRTIGAYDRPGDWVRRVVTNRAISGFRRKSAEKRALARVGPDVTVATPVPEQDSWLWQQVRSLPPRQAQAIALAYVEDLPLERVAAILGCAETTVKTHLSRGRQALARAIERRDLEAAALSAPPIVGAPVAAPEIPKKVALDATEVKR